MKKDVVYIDIEDEITGIISKMKESKAKIVALVPPKRSTVLNSVVNLKLLKRAADDSKKRVVLITNERSLVGLAGGLELFVAKNLHSKPEVPKVAAAAPEIDDSVIEGADIDIDSEKAVGELEEDHQGKHIDLSDTDEDDTKSDKKTKKMAPIKKGLKVPNFEAFRLRIILAVLGVFVLVGGWVWAFHIAPRASVNITAQTSRIDTVKEYIINSNLEETNAAEGLFKPQVQSVKRTVSEQFDATGEKEVGENATGTMTVQNCRESDPYVVPAGTAFTSDNGLVFETDVAVEVPEGDFNFTGCQEAGEAEVAVTATEPGDTYNLAAQGYTSSLTGIGGFGGQMSGGTSETVKVVSQDDFDAAKDVLRERNFDDVKNELSQQFEGEVVVIEESFQAREGKFSSNPGVNKEANKATLSVEMTFVMIAVDRNELAQAIEDDVNGRISTDQQSIYESGIDNVSFNLDRRVNNARVDVTMRTFTIVGPEIDEGALKEEIAGKAFSEARGLVEARAGVRTVEIDFDPFWVSNAPNADKITINVEIAESALQ